MVESATTSLEDARQQAKSLEADVTRTSQSAKVYVENFDFNSILKQWVDGFVSHVGDNLIAKAKLQLATRHISDNEVSIEYDMPIEIWEKAINNFPFASMVQDYINEHLKDGTAKVENSRAASPRDLVAVFNIK